MQTWQQTINMVEPFAEDCVGLLAEQFWSAVVNDIETATWFMDLPINKEGIASFTEGLKTNADGSVDLHFGPKAPAGKESNWVPTVLGRKFFLAFRFCGPRRRCSTRAGSSAARQLQGTLHDPGSAWFRCLEKSLHTSGVAVYG